MLDYKFISVFIIIFKPFIFKSIGFSWVDIYNCVNDTSSSALHISMHKSCFEVSFIVDHLILKFCKRNTIMSKDNGAILSFGIESKLLNEGPRNSISGP